MIGNYFICENRVVIEGKTVGQFERFSYSETRDSLEGSAKIYLPVYAIGYNSDPRLNAPPTERIRAALNGLKIKPGAAIEVWGKYSNIDVLEQKFTEVLLFKGFIRQVISGFPSLLICEDNAFILRFAQLRFGAEIKIPFSLSTCPLRLFCSAGKGSWNFVFFLAQK